MTIGRKILGLSAALLGCNLAIGVASLVQIQKLADSTELLSANTVPSVYIAGRVNTGSKAILLRIHRHFTSNSPQEMDKFESYLEDRNKSVREELDNYEKLQLKDRERTLASRIRTDLDGLIQQWRVVQPLSRSGKKAEAVALFDKDGVKLAEDLDAAAKELVASNKAASDQIGKAAAEAKRAGEMFIWVIILASFASGLVLSTILIRGMNRDLRRTIKAVSAGSEQVRTAAAAISSSSRALAEGAQGHAAALEETSAASLEINTTASRNVTSCGDAATLVEQARTRFQDASQSLREMVVAMKEIDESSGKISAIIKAIDEIAFQTNILALNAAVEAARAGESGMGFAVVADEVRNLAQRSAQAARDTSALIEDSIAKSRGGAAKVQHVESAIGSFGGITDKLGQIIHEVNLGSQEQAKGIDQVSKAMVDLEQLTQSTAAHSEEGAAAAEQLSAQAGSLQETINDLETMVDG